MKKILIIDDDRELCEEMAEILRDEGYSIRTAFSSNEGKAIIEEELYDIILLDYKMPHLTGLDILKEIKKNPRAKILLISGRPALDKLLEDKNVSGLVAGIMSKPMTVEALLQKIRSL